MLNAGNDEIQTTALADDNEGQEEPTVALTTGEHLTLIIQNQEDNLVRTDDFGR
jgi:hypothetical protein